MLVTASGESLLERRKWLGLSRSEVGVAAGLSADLVGKVERDTLGVNDVRRRLVADALTRLEAKAERDRRFPSIEPRSVEATRTRPWPASAMRALLDFHAEGAELGADIVALSCAWPIVVLVGVSRVGRSILSSSMGVGIAPDELCHRIDLTAGDADAALDALIHDGQLARVFRGQGIPPLRVLKRREPAIVAHRDGAHRVSLNVLDEPPVAPPAVAAAPPLPPSRKPARKAPRQAQLAGG